MRRGSPAPGTGAPLNPIPALLPLARIYRSGVELRLALYERGLFRVHRAGRPVISIGNLSTGGTGKTPFTLWLAAEIQTRNMNPSILTRGYGRKSRGPVLVSNGEGQLASVSDSGDEPAVLARGLPAVPILADADRVRGAARIEALFPSVDLHLLDDGFSHVRLARDVDILLLDATAPDGGGSLLPAGHLREPLESMARADFIVVTKLEQAGPEQALALALRYAPGVPVYGAKTEILGLSDDRGTPVRPVDLPPETLVALSGIAQPDSFAATLRELGIQPTSTLAFPDHATYGEFRIGKILKAMEETGATAVITTEKDFVKLEGRLPVPIFRVRIRSQVTDSAFVPHVLAHLGRRPS